jgi:penicillin-binding protein 1C
MRQQGERVRRMWRRLAVLSVVVVIAAAVFVAQLRTTLVVPESSTFVTDRVGRPLTEVPGGDAGDRFGYWPMPYVLPMRLAVATRETEDRYFYEHRGVHLPSLARALWQNVSERRVISGASTLAMQVARMQSGRSRSLWAKVAEMVEAWVLVARYGHDQILRHYLTLAPYGARVHGAARAARFYFDKPVEDVSWLQAAWLAGLPQQPTRMGPFSAEGKARGLARAHRILRTLHLRGYLTDVELQAALVSDLGIVDRRPRPGAALHFAMKVALDARQARKTQLSLTEVKSTLDLSFQEATSDIVRRNLAKTSHLGAGNTSAIVLDAASGDVLAWVGSADYFDDEHKGAIDYNLVKRSPGSTLKPFVYALALDPTTRLPSRPVWTAATPLADTPMDIVDVAGRSYTPRNINGAWLGPMSLRDALGNSRNIPALRVLADVTVGRALDLFAAGGVADIDQDPSRYGLGLALGNLEVTPAELSALYLALHNGGMTRSLRFSQLDHEKPGVPLFSADVAALVSHVLADDAARRPSFPAGNALEYPYAVAVKTGTSQGFRDGWTAATTDRFVVVVWVGNHDRRRMNHLGGLAGTAEAVHEIVTTLSPVWKRHLPLPSSMPGPATATRRVVCALSGRLAGPECTSTRTELFLPGTEPAESCAWHRRVAIDVRTGALANDTCPRAVVQHRAVVDLPREYERWARMKHLPLAPHEVSRLCGGGGDRASQVELLEPSHGLRLQMDPDTPPEFATLRLSAFVKGGSDEEVVFLVDDEPVASVGAPWETRWSLVPGRHTITAVLAHAGTTSATATIVVRE